MTAAAVRPFEEDDLPGAASALVEVHRSDGYPVEGVEDPRAWVRSDGVVAAWVAEAEGRIVGHVAVMRPQGEDAVSIWIEQSGDDLSGIAVLARLFVVQFARKYALGRTLTEAAMAYGRDHGLRLVLDVMSKDTAAIRLYERLGWRKIGETAHTFGSGQTITALCYVAPA
ncbi:GNAT family N-acetyltransferase [Streptomyces sp. NPDC020875]|uniref:GNAT family N-acetyltransferase n=1 Tax=Streptomyces sp. NPDC020875 TaxID=3154898 RepID=UPI0033EE3FF7